MRKNSCHHKECGISRPTIGLACKLSEKWGIMLYYYIFKRIVVRDVLHDRKIFGLEQML